MKLPYWLSTLRYNPLKGNIGISIVRGGRIYIYTLHTSTYVIISDEIKLKTLPAFANDSSEIMYTEQVLLLSRCT
jgi:hypothetical protein